MPLTFGSAIFFSIISLIATFIYFGMRSRLKTASAGGHAPGRASATKYAALGLWGFSLLLLVLSCVTQVTTKNVGVVTSFGRPIDTLSNGLHLKAPWHKVTEFDAAVQTDSHKGNGDGDTSPCTDIRIGNQSVACLKQRQQTADAEAEANRKLSGSVSNDPNVLVSKSFDTLKDMVRSRQQIPAGFSCWPGGGSSVVIPSAKN